MGSNKKRVQRERREFTAEVKAEAVRMMADRRAAGATSAQVSRELDVRPNQLRLWARLQQEANGVGLAVAGETLEQENRRLHRKGTTTPMVQVAVGNGRTSVVECLVQCGANLDLPGSQDRSAREMATYMLLNQPPDANRRRIAEMCRLDPDALVAERDAQVVPTPTINAKLQQALDLATNDAERLGLSTIEPENLFFGLLRHGGLPLMSLRHSLKADFKVPRALTQERVHYGEAVVGGSLLPMSADAKSIMQNAKDEAIARRRMAVLCQTNTAQ